MRQVVLDTETTGLHPADGDRVIEIGCVELVNRRLTGQEFQRYLNPEREVSEGAVEVHGLTGEFLKDKPRFHEIEREFVEFIGGAELIIHNAAFDQDFLDRELARTDSENARLSDLCVRIVDSMRVARKKYPGQGNSVNSICKRHGIDISRREKHGALLDAKLLAKAYLAMTSGQEALGLGDQGQADEEEVGMLDRDPAAAPLAVIRADAGELAEHRVRLQDIDRESGGACLWLELEPDPDPDPA